MFLSVKERKTNWGGAGVTAEHPLGRKVGGIIEGDRKNGGDKFDVSLFENIMYVCVCVCDKCVAKKIFRESPPEAENGDRDSVRKKTLSPRFFLKTCKTISSEKIAVLHFFFYSKMLSNFFIIYNVMKRYLKSGVKKKKLLQRRREQ